MGLSIGCSFAFEGDDSEIQAILGRLSERFRRLPVTEVEAPRHRVGFPSWSLGMVWFLEGRKSSPKENEARAECLRLLGAPMPYLLPVDKTLLPDPGPNPFEGEKKPPFFLDSNVERRGDWLRLRLAASYDQVIHVPTEEILWRNVRLHVLVVQVGEGCEPFCIRLARVGPGRKWAGDESTKTQYASDFVTCHLAVIRMLEMAKEEGIVSKVQDAGGFWKKYSWKALARAINSSTDMLQAITGAFGGDEAIARGQLQAPVRESANYLRLKGKPGRASLPDWFVDGRDLRRRK